MTTVKNEQFSLFLNDFSRFLVYGFCAVSIPLNVLVLATNRFTRGKKCNNKAFLSFAEPWNRKMVNMYRDLVEERISLKCFRCARCASWPTSNYKQIA